MQARSEETKKRILEAARDIFAAKGFHGARMDEIAAKAKINKERIYSYFGSKEKLFGLITKNAMKEMARAEEIFLRDLSGSTVEIASRLISQYMEFHEQHPFFWRLLIWENLEAGDNSMTLGKLRNESLMNLRNVYERNFMADGKWKKVPFETFFYVITAVSFFYFTNLKTMKHTLNADMESMVFRKKLVKQIVALLFE